MPKMFEFPKGFDSVAFRISLSEIEKQVEAETKPDHCILCGKQISGTCNSHSVPRMVLQSIAENGMLLQSNALVGLEAIDIEKGINNSGTFHFICNDCDKRYFEDYEDPLNICQRPTDKMLAEIALKNTLLQISKRVKDERRFAIIQDKYHLFENLDDLLQIFELDKRDYMDDLQLYKDIIDNGGSDCFQQAFWQKFPYRMPIATQTTIALMEDTRGNQVIDVFDTHEETRIENLHLCVFPIKNESVVMMFSHKRDRKYRGLRKQFVSIPDKKCLEYINWLIFKYSENYFISKKIQTVIETNDKLQELSQENSGYPNMGFVDFEELHQEHDTVGIEEIPNLLSPQYAI